ncbi:hypothetical protein PQQ32_05400 [Brachyspira hyodysenteriae]|uniref:Uncharacterized protein n=1 Tax=Brachyspira hyodysenteriae ATCC 27164 TaxID=1266923 RepID=A0A3B6VT32_BRAHO|nr:hypothetical protein [Brachyspira hyodysenteriae]ANN64088.1 hypothetical protein BHYOB78_09485 [Brachyspira hyodysenteriae ATCC 27164]KLI25360.1 hypothetical protein SZ47_06705 [Brachyspira hyodysenteriae]TVL79102.1 hypothetical protein A9X81_13300 [Brachyspira hyodysenteriae]TVL82392.1 hypothetical protein A9X80_00525 [Brachyspira hyodysenteriae]WPC38903.1 hypothetical protein PQQ32_05400 [Brachyspira hyodysenteriae]
MENKDFILIENLLNSRIEQISKIRLVPDIINNMHKTQIQYLEAYKNLPIANFDNVFNKINFEKILIPRFSDEIQSTISKLVDVLTFRDINILGLSNEFQRTISMLTNVFTFRNINIPMLQYKEIISNSINEALLKLEENKDINLENIDKNEIEELKNDLEEIHKENVISLNWQQKIFDVYKKWAKKNPIIALILSVVVPAIISFYIGLLLPVRKDASSNSQIINKTIINNITIINDVKYYYEVETKDNEGNIINGYVSKRKYNQLKSNKTFQK